jgi:hypothetical protein
MTKKNTKIDSDATEPSKDALKSIVMDRESKASPKGIVTTNIKEEREKYDALFFKMPHLVWWICCLGGMILTFVIARAEGPVMAILPVDRLALAIFGTRKTLQYVFNLAVLAHFVEAQYAVYVCTFQLRLSSWPMWALQTLLLGYPSLSLLLERRAEVDKIIEANLYGETKAQASVTKKDK